METYTFGDCTVIKLEELFGLRRTLSSHVLDQWLQTPIELSEFEKTMLQHLRQNLTQNAEAWNEQELTLSVIGPLFSFVQFSLLYRFNFFSQRTVGATITGLHGDIKLSGEPDGMVATGYWRPETPMFAFSEYKRLQNPSGDPAGQSLAAMLVGQSLNKNPQPIYGCYVIGDAWRFLVLEGREYVISQPYSAIRDDIFDIFRILKALKLIIMELTADDLV
ncbi:MAG: hypothetical protein AAF639_27510 [Chloroflexota bacterium]